MYWCCMRWYIGNQSSYTFSNFLDSLFSLILSFTSVLRQIKFIPTFHILLDYRQAPQYFQAFMKRADPCICVWVVHICIIVFCSPITLSKLLVNICFQIPGVILFPVSATQCLVYIILIKEINLVNLFFKKSLSKSCCV